MYVLLTYLAGSSASMLENTLVEQEQLASSVPYEVELRPKAVIQISLTSVATDALEKTRARLFTVLKETAAMPLDMQYIQDCIKRERRQSKFYAEGSGQYFNDPIIYNFLFGERNGSALRHTLEDLKVFDQLEEWDDLQWRHWLSTWIAEAPSVTVIAKPSAALAAKLKTKEKARIKARTERLGAKGLEDLGKRLATAKNENSIPIPRAILENFVTPGTDSIHFIGTTTARSGPARAMGALNNGAQQIIDKEEDLPLFLHFEDMRSNFAYISLVLGTDVVPLSLRPLLPIYIENFFSAPLSRNGKVIAFDQVIKELEHDTVDYGMSSGRTMGNSETIIIKLQVEVEKYQMAIRWVKELMNSSIFDLDRIKATTTRLIAEIPDSKRDGSDMVNAVELMTGTTSASISRASSTLVKALYLKRVRSLLEKDPQMTLDQLASMNASLCQPSNMRILVAADLNQLRQPVESWKLFVQDRSISTLKPLDSRLSRLSEAGRSPGNTAYIIPISSLDTSYALIVSKGPSSFFDDDFAALMVAVSYLNAVEGPFWTAVRGTGLAYGTSMSRHVDSGQISLDIYSSPDAFKAFVACKAVVEDLVSGATLIDLFTFEGAISSIVLGFANAEATRANAAQSSFVRQVIRDLPKDWPTVMLARIRQVTVSKVRSVLRRIVMAIFDARTANLFITCGPGMQAGLLKGFNDYGYEAEVKPLTFFQDDYGLKERDENDEPSLEEEDDDDVKDDDEGEDDEDHQMETEG